MKKMPFLLILFLFGCGKLKPQVDIPSKENFISFNSLEEITSSNVSKYSFSGKCSIPSSIITISVNDIKEYTTTCLNNETFLLEPIDLTSFNKEAGSLIFKATMESSLSISLIKNNFICPDNFVAVPPLTEYTSESFCIAKYEMKDNGLGEAVSKKTSSPYVNLTRDEAITKCQNMGAKYDLITNDEWQTTARNIELNPFNWDTGVIGGGEGLNRGNSDKSPGIALEASTDDDPCYLTEQSCTKESWDSQKRTHQISNGELIWDLSGNVWEWVKDDNTFTYHLGRCPDGTPSPCPNSPLVSLMSSEDYPATGFLTGGTTSTTRDAKGQFGPTYDYPDFNDKISHHGGFGVAFLFQNAGTVHRGGHHSSGANAEVSGIFATSLGATTADISDTRGFRCSYHP